MADIRSTTMSSPAFKWNAAAFKSLQEPTTYPTASVPFAAGGVSHMLYALDEKQKATAAKKAATRKAKARIGVKAFSWEAGA
jgi:hypothetical protein